MPSRIISVDLKRVAVRLMRAFSIPIVAILLDISEDTVRRAIASFELIGDVVPEATSDGPTRGRPRLLNDDDLQVRPSSFHLYILCLPGMQVSSWSCCTTH
jgi:hypothetical protein